MPPAKKKPDHLKKKNVVLYIEGTLIEFAKEKLPQLNLSKIATDAIIDQIEFALDLLESLDPPTWSAIRYDFDKYKQKRSRVYNSEDVVIKKTPPTSHSI
jgi:hypothetical protein